MDIRAAVLEALKNAAEGGYLNDLAAMTVDEVVADLQSYAADLEGIDANLIKPVVQEWRDSYT